MMEEFPMEAMKKEDAMPESLGLKAEYPAPFDLAKDITFLRRVVNLRQLENSGENEAEETRKIYGQMIDDIIEKQANNFEKGKVFFNLIIPREKQVAGLLPSFLNKCFHKLEIPEEMENAEDNFIHAAAEIYINLLEHNKDESFPLKILLAKERAQILLGEPKMGDKKQTKEELVEEALALLKRGEEDLDEHHRGTPLAALLPDEVERLGHSWLLTQYFPAKTDPENQMAKYFLEQGDGDALPPIS